MITVIGEAKFWRVRGIWCGIGEVPGAFESFSRQIT
jgi:hypothetical protein